MPAVGKEAIHLDASIRNEARALALTNGGKRPRADQCDLTAEKVVAHVERHVVALTYEARLAPGSDAADRLRPRGRGGRRIEAQLRSAPVGEILDCLHDVLRSFGIDDL